MPKKTSPNTAPTSFEAAMSELSALVAQMEAGKLPLEASVLAYRRGAELIQYCAAQLEIVEQQVSLLDADILKPFDYNSENPA